MCLPPEMKNSFRMGYKLFRSKGELKIKVIEFGAFIVHNVRMQRFTNEKK